MLNIEHLTKTYGGKAAVQDLSLHIRPGEICAFIGHNGAGKTTTLKCCCGIQQFDSGRITVDGISVQDDPLSLPWVKELLASGQLAELDRPTVAAAIREIRVYEGNRMEIDYLLPEGCRALLEG